MPAGLCGVAVVLTIFASPWWLLFGPFVIIGRVFTAPNLNLANSLPSHASMVGGALLMKFHQAAGTAVLAGVIFSFYGSALEMRFRRGQPMSKCTR